MNYCVVRAKRLSSAFALFVTLAAPSLTFAGKSDAATGPFGAVMEFDPSISPAQTVYRPRDLGFGSFPIVVWGNGGCAADGGATSRRFLLQIASEGYVIVAPGRPGADTPLEPTSNATAPSSAASNRTMPAGPPPPAGPPQSRGASWPTSPAQLVRALDWLVAENGRKGSPYFGKLDVKKVAVMGRSCGGVQALSIQSDPRIVTSMIWNSGLFDTPFPLAPNLVVTKESLKAVRHPIAYISGGPSDMSYANARDDFSRLTGVPVFFGEIPVGHDGTMAQANGGSYAHVATMWLDWQLKGSLIASYTFIGSGCELCRSPDWKVQWRNAALLKKPVKDRSRAER